MTWEPSGVTIADPEQVVLESEPYRRLVLHLAHVHAGVGRGYGISEDFSGQLAAERRSKVTFDIEPLGQMVKLTVVHDDFDPGSVVLEGVSRAGRPSWPASRRCSRPASPCPRRSRPGKPSKNQPPDDVENRIAAVTPG